jgi:hypothetical protein
VHKGGLREITWMENGLVRLLTLFSDAKPRFSAMALYRYHLNAKRPRPQFSRPADFLQDGIFSRYVRQDSGTGSEWASRKSKVESGGDGQTRIPAGGTNKSLPR